MNNDFNSIYSLTEQFPCFTLKIRLEIGSYVLHSGYANIKINNEDFPIDIGEDNFINIHLLCDIKYIIKIQELGIGIKELIINKKQYSENTIAYYCYKLSLKRLFPIPQAKGDIIEDNEENFTNALFKYQNKYLSKYKTSHSSLSLPNDAKIILTISSSKTALTTGSFQVFLDDISLIFYVDENQPLSIPVNAGSHTVKISMRNVDTKKQNITIKSGEVKYINFHLYTKLPLPRVYSNAILDDIRIHPLDIDSNLFSTQIKENNFNLDGIFDDKNNSIIHYYAFIGDINKFIYYCDIIDNSLYLQNRRGQSPFHFAVINSHFDIAYYYLKNGFNINSVDKNNNSALHMAIKEGNYDAVLWLIKYGASFKIYNVSKDLPLYIAHYYDRDEILKLLIALGSAFVNEYSTIYSNEIAQQFFSINCFYIDNTAKYFKPIILRKWYYDYYYTNIQTYEIIKDLDDQKDQKDELEYLCKYLENNLIVSGNPKIQYKLGLRAKEDNNLEKAELYFLLAACNTSEHRKACIMLSELYKDKNMFFESIIYLLRAITLKKQHLYESKKLIINKSKMEDKLKELALDILYSIEDTDLFRYYISKKEIVKLLGVNNTETISSLLLENNNKILHKIVETIDKTKLQQEQYNIAIPNILISKIVNLAVENFNVFNITAKFFEINTINIDEDNILGSGAFSSVYKGCFKDNINKQMAIKKIDACGDPSSSPFDLKCLRRECSILRLIKHPNILHYYGLSWSEENSKEYYYILTELAYDDLSGYLKKNKEILSLKTQIWILKSISNGMKCIHSYNINHRDLKPDNIFVFNGDNINEEPIIKIGDFGIAVNTGGTIKKTMACGTAAYMAPEMLMDSTTLTTPVLMKSDVFSFGYVIYEVLKGEPPFCGQSLGSIAMKVINAKNLNKLPLEIPDSFDNKLQDIIISCWASQPENRPSFDSITDNLEQYYQEISNLEDNKSQ